MREEVNHLSEEEKFEKGICLEEGCGKEVNKTEKCKEPFLQPKAFLQVPESKDRKSGRMVQCSSSCSCNFGL